ncbi:hypothetical protein M3Y96_00509500 [Aphelenchoides besseyi]|nr:hypothetical protein M3Y96_00509500 [Aphelenchoides besseyi]
MSSRRRRSDSRDRDRDRSRSRDRDRSYHSRDRGSRRRSPSTDSDRSSGYRRDYNRGPRRRSPWRGPDRQKRLPGPERRDVMPFTARSDPPPNAKINLTPEERDQRTIFILQLSRETRPGDLEDFFSSVGPVRDVRIITDSKTRRSKGIAYVEFWGAETVPLALALNGQKLRNAPLVIQQTCAERNRLASGTVGSAIGFGPSAVGGPLKLRINNLHPSITSDMLSQIFEPFGRIESCDMDSQLQGIGYVVFRNADDGKKALTQLNGFNLAGKTIHVGTVDDDSDHPNYSENL